MAALLSSATASDFLFMTAARQSSPYVFPQAHCIALLPINPHSQR
jgi:hypothetical protein